MKREKRKSRLAPSFHIVFGLHIVLLASSPASEANLSVKARVYWAHAEQRVGQPDTLFVRLEAENIPSEPLQVKLSIPPGALIENDADKIAIIGPSDWKRGEVVTSLVNQYFTYRVFPEKHLSATVSWRIRSSKLLNVEGTVEITSQNTDSLHLPLRFDFREGPPSAGIGQVPPPVPAEHEYLVGALNYPGWEPGQASGWSLLDAYPERKPALGYYDGGSVDVANWEIKWALENGVNFFVYCWYVLGDKKPAIENLFLGKSLHDGLLKSPFRDKFHFAILWCAGNSAGVTQKRLLNEFLPFWIANYFQNPGYLIIDGRPVLFVYDLDVFVAQQGGREIAKETVRLMREALVTAGFKGLWLVGEYRGTDPASFKSMEAVGFDASFPYAYGFPNPAENQIALDQIMEVAAARMRSVQSRSLPLRLFHGILNLGLIISATLGIAFPSGLIHRTSKNVWNS
jgi:hypothetical protein